MIGNNQFELAFHAILVCQKLLGTSYPIEVFYGGPSDLDAEKAETLAELDHVTVVDLFQVLPKVHSYGLEGWAMKPFALLASSFEEVIFMDADVLFFQDPAVVFEMQGYKNTGNVFFHDRQMDTGKSKTHEWFEGFMKELSPDANQLQYVKYNTIHEQDSGVVAINKRTSAYYGLLATCIMNLPPFQKTAYANVHGDKETFWISAELIKVPYYFPSGYGGAIGWMNPEKPASSVCGNLYHPDENWKPLWWNGGVKMNKHLHPDLFFNNMTFYATNMDGTQGEWDWETETRPFCYQPIQVNREIGELDEGLKNMGDKMIQTGKLIFEAVKENDMGRLIEISEMAF